MWKCPSCSKKSTSHAQIMKHYYSAHYKGKSKNIPNKGKEKKIYTFKPLRRK